QTKSHIDKNITHLTFKNQEANFLNRGLAYSHWVDQVLENQYQLQVGHFRDIWGGIPILKRPHITSVFEVNGLPSVELRDRYSAIPQTTIEKLYSLENKCLFECDQIICPSNTIKSHLEKRGIAINKIHVITNGATLPIIKKQKPIIGQPYVIYFGALQPWQGIGTLLRAMQYLADKPELKLVICSSHKKKQSRDYQKLCEKLGIESRVIWKHKISKKQLFRLVQQATASVAPLTECARNLEQGCSPLKLFESMACQTPIIASDLPVVREILTPDREAKLIRPDRPAELARAIRLMTDYPLFGKDLAEHAYKKLISQYTWEKIDDQLLHFYNNLLTLNHA
ncbi:MAG: glycosyltransferase, partial [Bacteroidota bacterium]